MKNKKNRKAHAGIIATIFILLVLLGVWLLWTYAGHAITLFNSGTAGFVNTGTGSFYGKVQAVEQHTENFCNNTLVYFEFDTGTGGQYGSQNKGSYCIENNSPVLISKLNELGKSGARSQFFYRNVLFNLCECDYDSFITGVA